MNLGKVLGQHVHWKYWSNVLDQYLEHQTEFLELLNANCTSVHYKKVVLKEFIKRVEHSTGPIVTLDGDVAAEYAVILMAASASDKSTNNNSTIVTYRFGDESQTENVIKMREDPWVIAQLGSTGHRTWEAALALGDYLINNRHIVQDKQLIELGAGTGFVGILGQKLTQNGVILTDGDEKVVQGLASNIELNGMNNHQEAEARKLYWGTDTVAVEKDSVIVCADVTYESELISNLVDCMGEMLGGGKCEFALLAATMRSLDTFAEFEGACGNRGLKLDLVTSYQSPFEGVEFFIPPENPEICIYRLTHG